MEPTIPAVEQLKIGQVWRFASKQAPGRAHYFFLGDCRDDGLIDRVTAVFPTIHNSITSPPYANQRSRHYGGVPPAQYVRWFEIVQAGVGRVLADDGSFFVNIKPHVENGERHLYVDDLKLAMARRWGWKYIDDLCWRRQGFPGRFPNRFKNAHEPVFHFAKTIRPKWRPENVLKQTNLNYALPFAIERQTTMGSGYGGETGRNVRSGKLNGALPPNVLEGPDFSDLVSYLEQLIHDAADLPSNVIEAYTGAHSRGIRYGATFPLWLPEFHICAYSDVGDVWLDPFAGSGTVAEAAEKNGRLACLIDINPQAAQVTMQRLARLGLHGELVDG